MGESGTSATSSNSTVWREGTSEGRLRGGDAPGDSNVPAAIGVLATKKTTQRASTRLKRHRAIRHAFVALRPEEARKMTQVPSARATPHQPSRDHEIVTQRLTKSNRPRGSRGIRTRHGETDNNKDRPGWGGRGRRRRRARSNSARVVVWAAGTSRGKRALKNGRGPRPGSVGADDGNIVKT